ncbi:MAG: sigma-70 family RNA polymerase sigma factor [Fibrobacterota bacterium]
MPRGRANDFFVEEGNLGLYLREISKYRTLSAEEEAVAAVKIRKGDQKALETLVKANLRFVISVARNYQNQGLPLEDLINEGNVGLIRAAHRFDEKKNFKFISYAVWWIRQAILQSLAEQSRIVKLPINCVGRVYKVGKVQSRLEQKFMRLPNEREVSEELGLSENDVINTLKIGSNHKSLDAPMGKDNDDKFIDLLRDTKSDAPDHDAMDNFLKYEVDTLLLSHLNQREQYVIRKYFGIGEEATNTLDEIGQHSSLTRERVRQIKDAALQKLRRVVKVNGLREYITA